MPCRSIGFNPACCACWRPRAAPTALSAAGYAVEQPSHQQTGKHEAVVEKAGERTQLEWVTDSAFRFFPMQSNELFGYVLHPVDLAANKAVVAEDLRALATEQPVDAHALHRRIRAMIEDAARFIATLPSEAVGVVFLDHGAPVQPDVTRLDTYQRNPGAPAGVWPSSPEIGRAMLERYGSKPKPGA